MRGSLQDSRPYWLPDTCPRQDIRCHRTRVHVRVTPQERCGIGIHQIVFGVHDVVVVAARSGVDLTLLMPWFGYKKAKMFLSIRYTGTVWIRMPVS